MGLKKRLIILLSILLVSLLIYWWSLGNTKSKNDGATFTKSTSTITQIQPTNETSNQLVKTYQYSTANGDQLFPFIDINDVINIEEDSRYIQFLSCNGTRVYNRKNGNWAYGMTKNIRKKQVDKRFEENYEDLKKECPTWYHLSYYDSRLAKSQTSNGSYFLICKYDEGGSAIYDDIIDIQNERVYRVPYQNTQVFTVDDHYLWLGYERGISKINLETGIRTDFIVVPRFQHISGYFDYQGIRYITTSEGEIYQMDIKTGDIFKLYPPVEDGFELSNPLVYKDKLYFGSNNRIVFLDLKTKEWYVFQLGEGFFIRKLLLSEDKIWCFGNYTFYFEDGYTESGGLVVITGENKAVKFENLKNVPLSAYLLNQAERKIVVLTGKCIEEFNYTKREYEPSDLANRNYTCSISLDDLKVIENIPVSEDNIPDGFEKLKFSLSDSEQSGLVQWKVKSRMLEITGKKVEILGKESFTN